MGGHHRQMSDGKPGPVDDLKEGLGLLLRAAKGAVERLPTGKLEDVAKEAVKEVGRAFESLGTEIEKVVGRASGSPAPPSTDNAPPASTKTDEAPPPAEPPKYDDGYAPEPPKGPRVG